MIVEGDGYIPDAGELIWTEFDPQRGREQAGRRPALVLSAKAFSISTGFAIVCPITSRIRPFPSNVVLPDGLALTGEILVSHVRSIDILARFIRPTGIIVPPETTELVRAKLKAIIAF